MISKSIFFNCPSFAIVTFWPCLPESERKLLLNEILTICIHGPTDLSDVCPVDLVHGAPAVQLELPVLPLQGGPEVEPLCPVQFWFKLIQTRLGAPVIGLVWEENLKRKRVTVLQWLSVRRRTVLFVWEVGSCWLTLLSCLLSNDLNFGNLNKKVERCQ